jgi:propanediol dehydratase large subunit
MEPVRWRHSYSLDHGQSAVYVGSTSNTLQMMFTQFETGAKATSYTPTTSATVTRAADNVGFTIPSGITSLLYTFDDNSTQTVSVSAGAYAIPTNLNRPQIKTIVGS